MILIIFFNDALFLKPEYKLSSTYELEMDDIFKYNKNDCKDYYEILGCDQNSSNEQIVCEYKTRAVRLHPDKQHTHTEEAEEGFKQLVKAKQVLTDPEMRKSYDKWRSSGIAVSFEKWTQMGKEVHISMHWMTKSKKELMLGNGEDSEPNQQSSNCRPKPVEMVWNRDYDNEVLRKFRNYEI